jgi:glucose-1-phosphate adenylyltransferase
MGRKREGIMKDVTAVILGGGRGTRMFPLTLQRAKPAVGFAGKYRLIDIPISNCINSGIMRVFVLTQFMSASLHRHIMQTYHFETFSDGFVDILAAEQTPQGADWFQGTADSVRATLNHTTYYASEHMLILSGDHMYRMNYGDLIDYHQATAAEVTLCACPVTRQEAPRMGLLKVDDSGRIEEFVEKPNEPKVIDRFRAPNRLLASRGIVDDSERYLGSMGIYLFEPNILVESLSDPDQTDFGKEIIPAAIEKYRVMAYPYEGYWRDIGTIASYFEANISLAQADPPFHLYSPGWPIYTRTRSLPPSRVIRSEIRDSLLVEGSDISGARITDSIVGMRGIVREGSRLEGVVMLGSDFYDGEVLLSGSSESVKNDTPLGIGRNCRIKRAIIDKNARIGDDVVIRAKPRAKDRQEENYWIRDGITVVPGGAVIPPGTRL